MSEKLHISGKIRSGLSIRLLPEAIALCLFFCAAPGLWLIRSLPFTLEDYDQAKQAYAALFAVQENAWLVQELPSGGPASKPPLMAWISSGLHLAGLPWEWAWRFPPLASAAILLALVMATARRQGGRFAMWVAGTSFAFCILTLRISTLVRTDMMLALLFFIAVAVAFKAEALGRRLGSGEMLLICACFLAANFTKGPILGALILPGALAALILRAGSSRGNGGRIFALFLIALLPFLWWTFAASAAVEGFHDQIIRKEFLSRFESGEGAAHRAQSPLFYMAQLMRGWGPWFFILIALAATGEIRKAAAGNRGWLWLMLVVTGGLAVMSSIPSKRLDRIYPLVPVMALQLGLFAGRISSRRIRRLVCVATALAAIALAAYALSMSRQRYARNEGRLADFSQRALLAARHEGHEPVLEQTSEESLACYLRVTRPLTAKQILRRIDSLNGRRMVILDETLKVLQEAGLGDRLTPVESVETAGKRTRKFWHVKVNSTGEK